MPEPVIPPPENVPIPPVCSRAELHEASTVVKGLLSRLKSLPSAITELVLKDCFECEEFHKAYLAAKFFYLNTQETSQPLKAWIIACTATELEPVEDNGPEVPS